MTQIEQVYYLKVLTMSYKVGQATLIFFCMF